MFYPTNSSSTYIYKLTCYACIYVNTCIPVPCINGNSMNYFLFNQSCPTLCDPMDYSMPGFPVFHYLLEFAQTHGHWVSDAIQPYHPLSSPSPAFNLSHHQDLSQWVSSLHQVAKVLEFQLQYLSFQWILISFRMVWFDLLEVQGTLNSLLQHHSSKASILQHSAFFMVQVSFLYMTARKAIALTLQTFVSKVMSLLFHKLSTFVIAML